MSDEKLDEIRRHSAVRAAAALDLLDDDTILEHMGTLGDWAYFLEAELCANGQTHQEALGIIIGIVVGACGH
jgi:hypothetical protein